MQTRIKICGLTNLEDALLAVEMGADALGFILAESKRRITPEQAREILDQLPSLVVTVGVFMNQPISEVQLIASYAGFDRIQLHGNETPEDCQNMDRPVIKRIKPMQESTRESILFEMNRFKECTHLIDPGAGDGRVFDWQILQGLEQPYILAGGLNAQNVGEAVKLLNPSAVDVSSGVEQYPGKKDKEKLEVFIKEARC